MDDYRSILQVADRLISWREVDRAAELLEKYLRRNPGHPELLRRMGRIRLAQGRPREAAELLKQAIAHDKMMAPLREGA
jgi:cytochrome c-type biogenesis protein CcmH/NrfG